MEVQVHVYNAYIYVHMCMHTSISTHAHRHECIGLRLCSKYHTGKQKNIHLIHTIESSGLEQAWQMADCCFELVGSHQCHVCTSCSGNTVYVSKVSPSDCGFRKSIHHKHQNYTTEINPPSHKPKGNCVYMYRHVHVHVQCEGWLSPGGHSSGGKALTVKVRDPRFNPGWLPVFHSSLKIFLSLSSCT